MKHLLISLLAVSSFLPARSQIEELLQYEPSAAHPFGMKNPSAPEQLNDFRPMIGTCRCQSLRRNPDGTWSDTTEILWTFKYVMNGYAIQDQTWRDGFYATSIRTFLADSTKWAVSYRAYPSSSPTTSTWLGGRVGNNIVLDLPQKAPNGLDGISRLTFYDISDKGFNWKGEWINDEQGIVYPFWMIWCTKTVDPD